MRLFRHDAPKFSWAVGLVWLAGVAFAAVSTLLHPDPDLPLVAGSLFFVLGSVGVMAFLLSQPWTEVAVLGPGCVRVTRSWPFYRQQTILAGEQLAAPFLRHTHDVDGDPYYQAVLPVHAQEVVLCGSADQQTAEEALHAFTCAAGLALPPRPPEAGAA